MILLKAENLVALYWYEKLNLITIQKFAHYPII